MKDNEGKRNRIEKSEMRESEGERKPKERKKMRCERSEKRESEMGENGGERN